MTKAFIIVPLYIYPLEEAWEPLFRAARTQPTVRFVAIINPSNGPGPDALPDARYMAELHVMQGIPNISAVGYVHCSYGKRPDVEVRADVDKYRRWNEDHKLSLDGIFFDEAPSQLHYVSCMTGYSRHIRDTWLKELGRDAMVIYNPGVVVARPFFEDADYIVIFEQSQDHWNEIFGKRGLNHAAVEVRAKSIVVIHSCRGGSSKVAGLVKQARSLGVSGILVTDQQDGGYTRWPESWNDLTTVVCAENTAT